mmetsp:Transcript_22218/g.49626  ORF Transcript_22218/g.49626 Transcript_22218/m.49626 type:complete len:214 (-) Transcript_22218:478-1119(-)
MMYQSIENKQTSFQNTIDTINKENTLLKQDKTHLINKIDELYTENSKIKQFNTNFKNKIFELKKAKKNLNAELNELKYNKQNIHVNEILHNELSKIRVQSDEENKFVKNKLIEYHQSEVIVLNNQIEDMNNKIKNLEERNSRLLKENELYNIESANMRSIVHKDLHESNAELKTRSFELDRLKLALTEQNTQVSVLSNRNIELNSINDILRNE